MQKFEKLPTRKAIRPLLRVAAYARVSTAHERQASSIAQQIEVYQRTIEANPTWSFCGVFVDDGISGTSTKGRLGLASLTESVEAGEIDLVLTKSISRLARNTVDLLSCVRNFKAHGCDIFFEREGIYAASSEGEIMLSILASFAQEESESNSKNVTWALRERYKEGIPSAKVAYGYKWTGTEFVIVEEEAYVVRTTFENFLKGISPEKTAELLDEQGYRSRNGSKLRGYQLRCFLENERYMGCQLLQKSYVNKVGSDVHIKNDGVLPQYWVEDANPAIVSPELFNKVQEELRRRRRLGAMATPSLATSILTGRVRCGVCGKNYQRKSKTRKDGSKRRFWRCWSACMGKGACGQNIDESTLKQVLCDCFHINTFSDEAFIGLLDFVEVKDDVFCIHPCDGSLISVTR